MEGLMSMFFIWGLVAATPKTLECHYPLFHKQIEMTLKVPVNPKNINQFELQKLNDPWTSNKVPSDLLPGPFKGAEFVEAANGSKGIRFEVATENLRENYTVYFSSTEASTLHYSFPDDRGGPTMDLVIPGQCSPTL